MGAVTVNDTDTQRAGQAATRSPQIRSIPFAVGARLQRQPGALVDDLANRCYMGTVIVDDGNGRHFEPGRDRIRMPDKQLTF
ncbi:MAG: hypothetical protein ABI389_15910 [Rhodanobacter sp.]